MKHVRVLAVIVVIVGAVLSTAPLRKATDATPGTAEWRSVQRADARVRDPVALLSPGEKTATSLLVGETVLESEAPHLPTSPPASPTHGLALARVMGCIVDDGDGKPIANASISVGGETEVYSDGVGRFELSVPLGEGTDQVTLDVRREVGVALLCVPVSVIAGGVSDLTIRFPSAARLHLLVNEPIHEARVKLLRHADAPSVHTDYQIFTDYENWPEDREPRREWDVPGLVAGTYDVLVTCRSGVARGEVELRPGETVLSLSVEQYARLRIRGAVGRAIAATCLAPMEPDHARATWAPRPVEREGEEDWDVSPGRWLVTVLPKDRTLTAVRREVQLAAGGEIDLAVDFPPGRTVDVLVPRGLEGCSLVAWGPPGCWVSRTSDATLQLGGLGPGEEVLIEARGRAYGSLLVQANASTAELELGPPAELELLALSSDGCARHEVLMSAWAAHGDGVWTAAFTAEQLYVGCVRALQDIGVVSGDHGQTGPDGRVTLEGLPPGPRRIGCRGTTLATLELRSGARATCTIVLPDE